MHDRSVPRAVPPTPLPHQPAVANPYLPKKAVVNPYASSMAAAAKKKKAAPVVNPYGAAAAAGGAKAKPAGKSSVGGCWVVGQEPCSFFFVVGFWLSGWGGGHLPSKGRLHPYSPAQRWGDRWRVQNRMG